MNNVLILKEDSTFREAVKLLDENGIGFLAVTDSENHLLGILTDGDIRRAILNNKTELKDIINRNPQVVSDQVPFKQAVHLLRTIHRRHLPVVDSENKLVRVINLDDLDFNLKQNRVVIMAGGLGSRLGHLTKDTPKPMLEIGGKPLLEQLIESFVEYGFTEFLITVNFKAEVIMDYFGDGKERGVNIKYVVEKEKLGTGGSLSLIQEELNDPFFVVNGDIVTSLDFGQLLNYHIQKEAFGTMCVKEYEHQIPYATIEEESSKLKKINEKPVVKYMVNSGIYVLDPAAIEYVPKNEFFDLPTLFELAQNDGKAVYTYKMNDFWLDIGQIKDYEIANEQFKKFQ